ncbi:unnamed protein product [Callosobruchus maculatus]|uniref:Uncharacterized protein n=1 Tax=Callosobruchus maculatus TaxID=64391 RepID=A0A653BE83_CALMS|nr:unnamed protein product [Callosobruchus maculatus]
MKYTSLMLKLNTNKHVHAHANSCSHVEMQSRDIH